MRVKSDLMNTKFSKAPKIQRGFSLIEAVISMAAGLIVALAVTAFAMALLRSHTETIQSTRITQDLRVTSQLIANELKRSGFTQDSIEIIANQDAYSSNFDDLVWGDTTAAAAGDCPITVEVGEAASCLIFSYDRQGVNDASAFPDGREWKGFRRALDGDRGVVQMFLGDAASEPDCADAIDAEGWSTTTPPGIDVTSLALSDASSDPVEISTIPDATLQVRRVGIQMSSRVENTTPEHQICDEVRIRADQIILD